MIAVAGEALMDLVVDASGSVVAVPGGGPFNAARMVARLGSESRFVGRLSDDAFGQRLRAALELDGVEIAVTDPVTAPSTLAVAQIDDAGVARYAFYLDGTSAAWLRIEDLPRSTVAGIDALLFGGLGLVAEPMATTLLAMESWLPAHVVVMVDLNCRAQVIADPPAYNRRLTDFLARADVVKASTEDLRFLYPGMPPDRAARALLERGPRAVLVTDGAAPVRVHTRSAELSVSVPTVPVVDTVGAGDAFAAAFVTAWTTQSWTREDLTDDDALLRATTAAVGVASATCAGRGAHPPGVSRAGRALRV